MSHDSAREKRFNQGLPMNAKEAEVKVKRNTKKPKVSAVSKQEKWSIDNMDEYLKKIMLSPSPSVITYMDYLATPRGGVLCRGCGTILVSYSTHDYKTCRCPNKTMVDGGPDYIRYGGVSFDKVLLITVSLSGEQKLHEKKYKPKRKKA